MNILPPYFVALGLLLAVAPANGFVPHLNEGLESELLAKLGFAVSFKKGLGAGELNQYLWIAEVSFADREAAVKYKDFRVRIADAVGNVLFESDHTPGEYTAYTSPSFGLGGGVQNEKRFGFRVYIRAKHLPFTRIEFSDEQGIHTIPLHEFFLRAKNSEPLLSASGRGPQAKSNEAGADEPSVSKPTAGSSPVVEGNHRLSPNEAVRVTVLDEDDLNTSAQIAEDGTIRFPLIRSVRIGGKTLDEAAATIEAALREDYLTRPQVKIAMTEFAKQRVVVLGRVKQPGSYEIPANESVDVIKAVDLAGGFKPGAFLSRVDVKRVVEGKQRVFTVSRRGMADDANEKAFRILPGDVITVMEAMF